MPLRSAQAAAQLHLDAALMVEQRRRLCESRVRLSAIESTLGVEGRGTYTVFLCAARLTAAESCRRTPASSS
jgi:hypothetical protein